MYLSSVCVCVHDELKSRKQKENPQVNPIYKTAQYLSSNVPS